MAKNKKIKNVTQLKAILILGYILFLYNFVYPQYNGYNVSNGINFEIPYDTISENRYTIDNLVYKGNYEYKIKYYFLDSIGTFLFFAQPNGFDWEITKDSTVKNVIDFLTLFVYTDYGPFDYKKDTYDQSVIEYKYYTKEGILKCSENTGLVENDINVWVHPPRCEVFNILQLNPFPYVKFNTDNWLWQLKIGDAHSNKRWKEWNGLIINNYYYNIIGTSKISTSFYDNIDCIIIESTAQSSIGKTFLTAYYNEKIGFIRLDYINIDKSTIRLDIKKINDINN